MSRRHRAGKPDPSLRTRMRIARDPAKALAQYDDLRVRGRLNSAVILCDMKDGSFEVLSQGMKAPQIGRALMQASAMLMHADADVNALRLEPQDEPISIGGHSGQHPQPPTILLDAEGNLKPPIGTEFISCGECHHPRFYILIESDGGALARLACASCGNEINLRGVP